MVTLLTLLIVILVIVIFFAIIDYVVRRISVVPQPIGTAIVWLLCLVVILLYSVNHFGALGHLG